MFVPPKSIVLVGMMGAGKTSVGRRLASRLGLPFVDSDDEIEAAAGMTISQFFEQFSEDEFRQGERKVIARLLERPLQILSTGGGAFMNEQTRALIQEKAYSVYLKAEPNVLVERATRHNVRPLLLKGNPIDIMTEILLKRGPTYALADVTVASDQRPIDDTVDQVIKCLDEFVYNNT